MFLVKSAQVSPLQLGDFFLTRMTGVIRLHRVLLRQLCIYLEKQSVMLIAIAVPSYIFS